MKKLFIILFLTSLLTAVGLFFRPSYPVIGQLDWFNVLTKGYFVGSLAGFFSQGFLDESFYYVMRFSAGGFIGGILLVMMGGKSGGKSSTKKKKN